MNNMRLLWNNMSFKDENNMIAFAWSIYFVVNVFIYMINLHKNAKCSNKSDFWKYALE